MIEAMHPEEKLRRVLEQRQKTETNLLKIAEEQSRPAWIMAENALSSPPPRIAPIGPQRVELEPNNGLAELAKAVKKTASEVTAANERAAAAERRERWYKLAALVLPVATAVIAHFLP